MAGYRPDIHQAALRTAKRLFFRSCHAPLEPLGSSGTCLLNRDLINRDLINRDLINRDLINRDLINRDLLNRECISMDTDARIAYHPLSPKDSLAESDTAIMLVVENVGLFDNRI